MRVKNSYVCGNISWEKYELGGDIPEYLVESGKTLGPDFNLWNSVSNDIYPVQAGVCSDSIFREIKDPLKELKLENLDSQRTTSR